MATEQQIRAFIAEIAPYAMKAYKEIGKIHPSVCIGMACIESAYGTSKIMREHNAYFGQKVGSGKTATKYWNGAFFTSKTKEEYTIGTHTVITSAFRAYPNMEWSVFNYYELLNTKLYSRVKADVDYRTQMMQIKECGYMTSSTEVNSVIKVIEKYNLTQYDGVDSVPVPSPAPSPAPDTEIFRPTLKKGDKGEYVLCWQKYLNLCGFPCKEDGIFGSETEKAVKEYQKSRGLKPDGIIGAKTWDSVGK